MAYEGDDLEEQDDRPPVDEEVTPPRDEEEGDVTGAAPSEGRTQTSDAKDWDTFTSPAPKARTQDASGWDAFTSPIGEKKQERGTLADVGVGALHGFVRGAGELPGGIAKGLASLGGVVGLTDDPQKSSLYKFGENVEANANTLADYLPKPQGAAGQLTEKIFGGVAQVLPALELSPLALAVQMGVTTAGQEGAESAAANQGKQSAGAVAAGAAVGAAGGVAIAKLGPLLGKIMPTVERTAPGIYNWLRSTLVGVAREGTVFTGVNELMEVAHDKIAQTFYDPKAGYHPDIQRLLTSFGTGAVIGGLGGARQRVPEAGGAGPAQPGQSTSTVSPPITDPTRLLPKPADFTVSSEGEAARYPGGDDQVFADAAAPRPGGAQENERPIYEQPYRPGRPDQADQTTGPDQKKTVDVAPNAQQNTRGTSIALPAPRGAADPTAKSPSDNPTPAHRDGSQSGPDARQYAKGAEKEAPQAPPPDLSTMPADIQAARDAAQPAPKEVMPDADHQPKPGVQPSSNVTTPPREGPTPPAAAPSGEMPPIPDFLRRTKAVPAPTQVSSAVPPQVKSAKSTTGLGELGEMGRGIADNLHEHLWGRIQKGATTETDTGPQSAILQGAKAIRSRGGIQTPEQYRAYADDYGRNIDSAKPTFQRDMQDLIARHTPKRDFQEPKGGYTPEALQIKAEKEAAVKTKAEARFADLKANQEAKKRQNASFLPPKAQAAKDAIDAAAAKTNPEPTPAETKSGKYKKGTADFQGLKVDIETPRGAMRKGVGADGQPWEVRMPAHYGEIKGTRGADGDKVDAYIGDQPQSKKVFVIDQRDLDKGGFDEHKVMLGFKTRDEALRHYTDSFSDGRGTDRIGHVQEMTIPELKKWLVDRKQTTTPNAPPKPSTVYDPDVLKQYEAKLNAEPGLNYPKEKPQRAVENTTTPNAPQRGPLAREVATHHMPWYDRGYNGESRGGNEAEQAAWDRGANDRMNADRTALKQPQRAAEEHVEEPVSKEQENTLAKHLHDLFKDEAGSIKLPFGERNPVKIALNNIMADRKQARTPWSIGTWGTNWLTNGYGRILPKDAPNPAKDWHNSLEAAAQRRQKYAAEYAPLIKDADKLSPEAQKVMFDERNTGMFADRPYDDPTQPRNRWGSEAVREAYHPEMREAYDKLPDTEKKTVQSLRATMREGEVAKADTGGLNRILKAAKTDDKAFATRVRDGTETPADIAKYGQDMIDYFHTLAPGAGAETPYIRLIRPGDVTLTALREPPGRPAGAEMATDKDGNLVPKYTFTDEAARNKFSIEHHKAGGNMPTDRTIYVDKTGNDVNPETKRPFTAEDAKDDPELEKRYVSDLNLLHTERFLKYSDAKRAEAEYVRNGTFKPERIDVQDKPWFGPTPRSGLTTDMEHSVDSRLSKNKFYQSLSPAEKENVKQALIEAQLENSGATKLVNSRLSSQGISGFKQDVAGAFANWADETASQRALLDFKPQTDAALKKIDELAQPMTGDPATSNLRRAYANEIHKRQFDLESGKNTLYGTTALGPALHRALMFSSIDRLATPRFTVQQTTQPIIFSLPSMVAEYRRNFGTIGAAKRIARAFNDIAPRQIISAALKETKDAAQRKDLPSTVYDDMTSRVKSDDDRWFLQRLQELRGVGADQAFQVERLPGRDAVKLNIGSGTNPLVEGAVGAVEAGLTKFNYGLHRVSDIMAPINGAMETINRAGTGLAFFRAEMELHGSRDRALQKGLDKADETQVNYSQVNQPPMTRALGGLARIPLQFKAFGFNAVGLLGSNAATIMRKASTRADKERAALTIGGILGVTVLAAGVNGLPTEQLVSPVLTALKAVGFTDTDWRDIEMATRKMTAHILGQALGVDELGRPGRGAQWATSILAGGLPRAIGLAMTGNLGLNNPLTFGAPDYEKAGSRAYGGSLASWVLSQLGGSLGGIAADARKAANSLAHGDIGDFVEQLPGPKFASDTVKAVRGYMGQGSKFESDRGVKRGERYTGPEAVAKLLGFNLASDEEHNAFVFGRKQQRKEEANAKSDATTAWLEDPSGRNFAAARAAGVTPQGLQRARTNVRNQNNRSVNGLDSTPRTRKADQDAAANYYTTR